MTYVLATIEPTDGFKNRNKETKVILEKVHWHEQNWYQDEWFREHFEIIWFNESKS